MQVDDRTDTAAFGASSSATPLSEFSDPIRPFEKPSWRPQALTLLLVSGAVLRFLLWAYFRDTSIYIWDEQDYNALATNLVQHGEFTFSPGGPLSSARPPLYPALVAAIYELFGDQNFAAVRFAQAVLSIVTVVVVYRLGNEVASPRTAIWAAALFCFYPSLLVYNNLLLTESLFTLLLCGGCFLIVIAIRKQSIATIALAGMTLGLAALTRSVVWLAPPLLAAFLVLTWKGRWRQRVLAAITLVGAFAVIIAPWAVRNTRIQETFIAIDVMGGRNFMMGNYEHTPLYRSWDAIALEGKENWYSEILNAYSPDERRTQGQIDKLAFRQGVAFIREHPGLTLLRSTVKFFDFWGLERELIAGAGRGYFGQMSKLALLSLTLVVAGSYAAAVFLGIFGVFFAPLPDRNAHWLFLCVIAFVCGIHTLVFGHSRYHLPVIPFVLIYSAGALTHAGAIWRQRGTRKFAFAACLCGILAAGWTWSFIAVDWERFATAWIASA